jgi:hypothetical protein
LAGFNSLQLLFTGRIANRRHPWHAGAKNDHGGHCCTENKKAFHHANLGCAHAFVVGSKYSGDNCVGPTAIDWVGQKIAPGLRSVNM